MRLDINNECEVAFQVPFNSVETQGQAAPFYYKSATKAFFQMTPGQSFGLFLSRPRCKLNSSYSSCADTLHSPHQDSNNALLPFITVACYGFSTLEYAGDLREPTSWRGFNEHEMRPEVG